MTTATYESSILPLSRIKLLPLNVMPTPDASQFTQLKKYAAIDARGDNGVKVITHLYQPVPSVRRPLDFLASFSNKNAAPLTFQNINYILGIQGKPRIPSSKPIVRQF